MRKSVGEIMGKLLITAVVLIGLFVIATVIYSVNHNKQIEESLRESQRILTEAEPGLRAQLRDKGHSEKEITEMLRPENYIATLSYLKPSLPVGPMSATERKKQELLEMGRTLQTLQDKHGFARDQLRREIEYRNYKTCAEEAC